MKLFRLLAPCALLLSPLMSGCASGPSGGASSNAPNRLNVVLTINQTIDPNFYYGVAFDDNPNDGDGPNAILGNTVTRNGVIDGNWRVFVRYHLGQFEAFYREDPDDYTTERQILATNLFIAPLPRVTSNTLNFTLNLDAKVDSDTYFFTHTSGASPTLATDRFDINYVATNTIIFGADQDRRIKPVDADGPSTTSTSFEFLLATTRRATRVDDANDKNLGIDSSFSSVNFGQLDVRQLDLSVTRGSQ